MEKSFSERVAEAKAAVPSVSPQQAHESDNVVFIDPRKAEDIASSTGIIPGALNISLSDLNEKPETELPQQLGSHSRSIVTACQAGPMGALAAYALKQRGYNNVAYMEGGTQAWLDAGYATVR